MTFRVFHQPAEWAGASLGRRAVLTIGAFDGLHLGHQQILRRVVEYARQSALGSASALATQPAVAGAVTFDPHPTRVLRPEQAPPLIATLAQRLDGFQQYGLEAALVLKFDLALSQLSPEQFVHSILVEHLHAAAVLVGQNFRFGHRQAGDVGALEEMGRRFGFAVEVVLPVEVAGEIVSSTAVRRAVQEGDASRAAQLLGRPFSLTGSIQPGAGRGRAVLFPTLNLKPEQELLPRTGVYVTESCLCGKRYRSATNVGYRPTVEAALGRQGAATETALTGTESNGDQLTVAGELALLTIESHLLGSRESSRDDFDQQVTAGPLEVRFLHRLRDEMKFDGIASLRAQIERDLAAARDYFAARRSG